ncbi:MAG: preprotein translocase subunit SecG [candidate division WOR-3 bacterium]
MIKPLLLIIHIFCAILLIMVVLVQQSKGAGLASVFGGGAAEDILGVRGAPTFFQKLTWILVSIFMLTALLSAIISPRKTIVKRPVIESKIQEMIKLKPLQEEKEEAPFEFPQEEKK